MSAEFREAAITINGHPLTTAQSMTVRVALGAFTMDLQADGLGEDEHGKFMTRAYLDRIWEINRLLTLTHPAK